MTEQRHNAIGRIHALHDTAQIELRRRIWHRVVIGCAVQDFKNFVSHLRVRKTDADAHLARVRDGVLTDAAVHHAAVHQPAAHDVVLRLDLNDLVRGLEHCRAALLRRNARVGCSAVNLDDDRSAALAADNKAVVHVAGLKVERRERACRLFCEDLLRVRTHVQIFLVACEDELDRTFLPVHAVERLDRIQRHDQTGLHIQHAGAVCHAVLVYAERIILRRALLEYGVHVADEQKRRFRAAGVPLADEHVAGVLNGADTGVDAGVLHLAAQDAAYRVHAVNLCRAALCVHQIAPQVEHRLSVLVDVLTNLRVNLLHFCVPP